PRFCRVKLRNVVPVGAVYDRPPSCNSRSRAVIDRPYRKFRPFSLISENIVGYCWSPRNSTCTRGTVPMTLKRKGSWLVVSAVLAVTALMMLGLSAAMPQEVRTRAGNVNKKPSRYIKDPNPAWSSIAVNPENNMVVMTDENLFRIVEYSRLDNTPLTARF